MPPIVLCRDLILPFGQSYESLFVVNVQFHFTIYRNILLKNMENKNDIGYFHQRIFQYIANCHVPPNGEEGGWDVIYENANGIEIPDAGSVHTMYVEMKNKHNTVNSASAGKTFIKMQNQLLNDDDCACFLVEAIAQRSQNIKWEATVDKKSRT